jgi:hypothetical protein
MMNKGRVTELPYHAGWTFQIASSVWTADVDAATWLSVRRSLVTQAVEGVRRDKARIQ